MVACNSENASDCFKTTGKIVNLEVNVPGFDKIVVNRDIELIIKEGTEQKVVIETGKNLLNDVEASVLDGRLILANNNSCNYLRGRRWRRSSTPRSARRSMFRPTTRMPTSRACTPRPGRQG